LSIIIKKFNLYNRFFTSLLYLIIVKFFLWGSGTLGKIGLEIKILYLLPIGLERDRPHTGAIGTRLPPQPKGGVRVKFEIFN